MYAGRDKFPATNFTAGKKFAAEISCIENSGDEISWGEIGYFDQTTSQAPPLDFGHPPKIGFLGVQDGFNNLFLENDCKPRSVPQG